MRFFTLLFLFFPSFMISQSIDTISVNSNILDRQIEVFVLDFSQGEHSPIFYLTDGKKMIESGTAKVIDSLTNNKLVSKAKYIFVSTIDPNTQEELRNEFFFCNEDYIQFFEEELTPEIEGSIRVNQERYLIGISFGAMNAAFFAAKTNSFQGYAMLSPITYPCNKLNQTLVFSEHNNYKVYLSTGKFDAEYYIESLFPTLKSKTTKIKLVSTTGGHDFDNWNSQMEDIINFMTN